MYWKEEGHPSVGFSIDLLFFMDDSEGQFAYGFCSTSSKQFIDRLIWLKRGKGSLLHSLRGCYRSEKALKNTSRLYPNPPIMLNWLTKGLWLTTFLGI
jgi:hypothetical protein